MIHINYLLEKHLLQISDIYKDRSKHNLATRISPLLTPFITETDEEQNLLLELKLCIFTPEQIKKIKSEIMDLGGYTNHVLDFIETIEKENDELMRGEINEIEKYPNSTN